jgi:hypothetical protein
LQYRTIPGIARFVLSLLSTNRSPDGSHRTRLEDITLPPHHQDKPGDHPTCKGFALAVLRSPSDVEFLLHKWPWDRTSDHSRIKAAVLAESPDDLEASKFGFRTLSKTRWEELREEYLAYRKQLVEEINAFEVAETLAHIHSTSSVARKSPETTSSVDVSQVVDAPKIDPSSPYPVNSLVFVRNVHPETNKTTLRKFFATAFVEPLANGAVQGDGLDYVDFNKGMDSVGLFSSYSLFQLIDMFSSAIYVLPLRIMQKFLSSILWLILCCRPVVWMMLVLPQWTVIR